MMSDQDLNSCRLVDDPVSPGWTMARGGLPFAPHAYLETSAQGCDLQHGPVLSDTNCLSCQNITGVRKAELGKIV